MLDAVRLELEKADVLGGVLLMHSLAGGTGAGVGTYLAEAIMDTLSPPVMACTTVRGKFL